MEVLDCVWGAKGSPPQVFHRFGGYFVLSGGQLVWDCVVGLAVVIAWVRDCTGKCQNLQVHCIYVQVGPGTPYVACTLCSIVLSLCLQVWFLKSAPPPETLSLLPWGVGAAQIAVVDVFAVGWQL